MVRRIISTLILVPLAVVIIAFAVANRQWITVSFDPFSSTSPAYAATLPLFAFIFVSLILGVVIGGAVAWIGQAKWRRTARKLERASQWLCRSKSAASRPRKRLM